MSGPIPEIRNHTQSPDDSIKAGPGSHVQVTRVDLGEKTLLLAVMLMLVIGACGVVMGLNIAEQHALVRSFDALDRQARMTELKLDDWTVVAHRAGLALPSDYTRGPQGNPDVKAFQPPAAAPLKPEK